MAVTIDGRQQDRLAYFEPASRYARAVLLGPRFPRDLIHGIRASELEEDTVLRR